MKWSGEKVHSMDRAREWTAEIRASARVFFVRWFEACGCGKASHGCHRRGWHVEVSRDEKERKAGPFMSRKMAQARAERMMTGER